MNYYRTCPICGAALDPGEICECVQRDFSQLTDENKGKINALISEKLEKQEREAFLKAIQEPEKRAAVVAILESAGLLGESSGVNPYVISLLTAVGVTQRQMGLMFHKGTYIFRRQDIEAAWAKGLKLRGQPQEKIISEIIGEAKPRLTIAEVNEIARAAGLTYGQFMAGGKTNVL